MLRRYPRLLPWLFVLAVGVLGVWQFHIPQFASGFDTFPGDRGDARLVAYLMEHWYQVLLGHENWASPPMFYPVHGTIGYADLVLGYGLVYSIPRLAGLGIFESAEFSIILLNFLNYLVCFILLHKILRFNLFAACAGAVFFAFNSPKLVQLGHLQLQPMLFLPLAVIAILLFINGRNLSQTKAFALIALAAVSVDLQLMTGFYPAWFFVFCACVFFVVTLIWKRTRTVVLHQLLAYWRALAAGLLLFVAGLCPFVAAYLPILRSMGGRKYDDVLPLIPVPLSLVLMGDRNYLWGKLSVAIKAVHPLHPELQIGIGLVPSLVWIALTLIALWFLVKNARDTTAAGELDQRTKHLFLAQLIVTTTLVYVLGMRYGNDHSPWQFVYLYFPGGSAIRAVARYVLVLALPMAIAFAFVIHVAIERISRQANGARRIWLFAALALVTAFGLAEQFGRREGFNGFSISAENAYLNRLAQTLPSGCSAFYVAVAPTAPHNIFEYQLDAALVSMKQRVPTLNGYSGLLPPDWGLWDLKSAAAYESNVRQWIAQNRIGGRVCRLFIDEKSSPFDITDPDFFVRQQYEDVLGREPDPSGRAEWLKRLSGCQNKPGLGPASNCDRVSVSLGILDSDEFARRSYFVLRLYQSSLGRMPSYEEFLRDRASIISSPTPDEENKNKEALVKEWIERPEFKSLYDQLANAEFVDKLLHTAALPPEKRESLLPELESHQQTRAQIVRLVVDDPQTLRNFHDRTFVLMQFFANLNRDPKPEEYQERVTKLNATKDYRQLVFDFIYSVEYRRRFGYVN